MHRHAAAWLLHVAVVCLAAHVAAGQASVGDTNAPIPGPLRFWIDEFFFADAETVLLREAIASSGGAAELAGETRNRVLQLKSYQQLHKLDVAWTGREGCYAAFKRRLNATHAVSCVPGTQAVSGKATLIASLEAAFGEAAWGIAPRSFRLPQQYADMAAHLKQQQRSGHSGLWVLKEDVHRGKGVGVVTPARALARAMDHAPGGRTGRKYQKYVLVQQFLGNQYLVAGRPFYIRLWAVLMGADPARTYLYDGGVVVFGQQQRAGQSADALIVNLWTQDRAAAAPWSLRQLEQHLEAATGSTAAPQRLRRQLHAAVAASLAAGLPNVRRAAAHLPGFQGGSFEVLGVDFLVDASLRPWLVEVNFLPSLARKVIGCSAGNTSSTTAAPAGDGSGSGGDAAGSNSGSDGGSRSGSADGSSAAADSGAAGSSSGDGAAGSSSSTASSSSSTASSSSSRNKGCQQDNPFDVQKEGFVRALLQLLVGRHRQHASLAQQAEQVLQAASEAAAEGQEAPCLQAQQLTQLLAMQAEQAAAEQLGFVPLTTQLYRSLGCMAARHNNGSSADTGGDGACAVLAELAPPEQQQCSNLSSPGSTKQLLQAWAGRLLLEGASLLPRLLHSSVRWQRPGASQLPPAYLLRASDQRMLAWMQGGSPPLSSPQALLRFCDAAA